MAAARGNGNAGGGGRRGGRGGPGAGPLPAEAAQDLISKSKDLASADGVITGALTDEGIKAYIAGGRGRRGGGAGGGGGNAPDVTNGKGTLKIWTKDGALSKYEYHLTGTVSRGGNDVDVDRTTTVEINDVGNTKIEVPEAAAKKLG
jgi:hypothetical protein